MWKNYKFFDKTISNWWRKSKCCLWRRNREFIQQNIMFNTIYFWAQLFPYACWLTLTGVGRGAVGGGWLVYNGHMIIFMDSFHLDTPTFLICHRTKLRKTRKLGLSISFKIRLLVMCCKFKYPGRKGTLSC